MSGKLTNAQNTAAEQKAAATTAARDRASDALDKAKDDLTVSQNQEQAATDTEINAKEKAEDAKQQLENEKNVLKRRTQAEAVAAANLKTAFKPASKLLADEELIQELGAGRRLLQSKRDRWVKKLKNAVTNVADEAIATVMAEAPKANGAAVTVMKDADNLEGKQKNAMKSKQVAEEALKKKVEAEKAEKRP